MTQATSKSDQAIFNLLTAAKNGPPVDPESTEVSDYDWNVPCRFTPAQLDSLGQFAERTATAIAEKLSAQLHEETQLWTGVPSQHYAGRLPLLEGGADSFIFPVTVEDAEQCGLVVIPGELARGWVSKALGGSKTAGDNGHEFSTLESALMRDVVVAVVEALSNEYRPISGRTLQCGRQVSAEEALPEVRNEDEYCLLAFRLGEEKDQAAISFILVSETLVTVGGSGIGITAQPGDKPPGDSRANLLACINQAPVTATVSLMTLNLSLREALNMEVGDVLISDKRIGETLEVLVGGAVVVSGHPVSCDGHYALQITT